MSCISNTINVPFNKVLCLIDEVTTLPICGVDTIRLKIDIYILEIENVLYGPRLKDTIFSITEHIKYKNCSFIGRTQIHANFPRILYSCNHN